MTHPTLFPPFAPSTRRESPQAPASILARTGRLPRLVPAWLCLATALWAALPAGAQEIREFPLAARRGRLVVTAPPQVQLDGRADMLAPGVRIRNPQNLLVMSASIAGQELRVNYLREPATGMLQEVWILSEAEAALRRPGSERPWYNFIFGGSDDATPK